MEKWMGKIAVITGASGGIGANIATELANSGMVVIGLARRSEEIQKLSALINGSGQVHARKCDITVPDEIESSFEWIRNTFGHIDLFINNAGIMQAAFLIDGKTSDFNDVMQTNVVAACVCIREAINIMRNSENSGRIIIINSILGHRIPDVPIPLFSIYPASKFALTAISQTVRQEISFHKANIKLTSISPGMVDTPMLNTYSSTLYAALPKLKADDVTSAVLYVLSTPEHVQVDEIILQAVQQY